MWKKKNERWVFLLEYPNNLETLALALFDIFIKSLSERKAGMFMSAISKIVNMDKKSF